MRGGGVVLNVFILIERQFFLTHFFISAYRTKDGHLIEVNEDGSHVKPKIPEIRKSGFPLKHVNNGSHYGTSNCPDINGISENTVSKRNGRIHAIVSVNHHSSIINLSLLKKTLNYAKQCLGFISGYGSAFL